MHQKSQSLHLFLLRDIPLSSSYYLCCFLMAFDWPIVVLKLHTQLLLRTYNKLQRAERLLHVPCRLYCWLLCDLWYFQISAALKNCFLSSFSPLNICKVNHSYNSEIFFSILFYVVGLLFEFIRVTWNLTPSSFHFHQLKIQFLYILRTRMVGQKYG